MKGCLFDQQEIKINYKKTVSSFSLLSIFARLIESDVFFRFAKNLSYCVPN